MSARPSFATLSLLLTLLLTTSPLQVIAQSTGSIQFCGSAPYNTSLYTCSGPPTELLCPIIAGTPTLPCGPSCYSPYMYTCDPATQTLTLLPFDNGPFTLTASNPTAVFDGMEVQASANAFFLGLAEPSTYCPSIAGAPPDLCTVIVPGTNTSLYPFAMVSFRFRLFCQLLLRFSFPRGFFFVTFVGEKDRNRAELNVQKAVISPGGQDTYFDSNGAMAFTSAHLEGDYPPGAVQGSRVYVGGAYFGPGGEMLTACPYTGSESGKKKRSKGKRQGGPIIPALWQVFARVEGFEEVDCVDFYAVVNQEAPGTEGAFEYT